MTYPAPKTPTVNGNEVYSSIKRLSYYIEENCDNYRGAVVVRFIDSKINEKEKD